MYGGHHDDVAVAHRHLSSVVQEQQTDSEVVSKPLHTCTYLVPHAPPSPTMSVTLGHARHHSEPGTISVSDQSVTSGRGTGIY